MSKALVTDLYQLTMNAAYAAEGKNEVSTFDLFVRKLPKHWGYLVTAGLEDVITYVKDLRFTPEDVSYLRSLHLFDETYLATLLEFRFTGDVWAVPEGTVLYANEPIIRVTAPKQEAQLIETYLLNKINFQTLIATKASRVVAAAGGAPVFDFGLRRAQDESAGINGARAAYIGGCSGTSNVEAGRRFGIPVKGTHAHSFVMSFDTELEAFRAYVKTFPENATLLIDTYDTMQGARNAIIVAKELENRGRHLAGVRLDSGDLAEDSRRIRALFDGEGLRHVKIVASNDLNEQKIIELRARGACIDAYGVGTELITSRDAPALGGVYKLVAQEGPDGIAVGKMKFSPGKKSMPGKKQVYRSYTTIAGEKQASLDILALADESLKGHWRAYEPLLNPIFQEGKLVYNQPTLENIKRYAKEQIATIAPFQRCLENPVDYYVGISEELSALMCKLTQQQKETEVIA